MNSFRPLDEITQSDAFYARWSALAMRVAAATNSDEVTALLGEAATVLGADVAAFASFMRDDEHHGSYRFILACDAMWCLEYEAGACYMQDPWLDYARHHSEPTLASRIAARTHNEREVIDLAQRFGFASAVIVPTQSPQGLTRLGALCFGSGHADYFTEASLPAVTFAAMPLALQLHQWQIAQLRQELLNRVRFSEDEIAMLRLLRSDLSTKEIASAMKMTPMSVDSRLCRLILKLGVTTRMAVVNMAAEYGVI
jgi:DNA-binding CsgD family transcriptional regulator